MCVLVVYVCLGTCLCVCVGCVRVFRHVLVCVFVCLSVSRHVLVCVFVCLSVSEHVLARAFLRGTEDALYFDSLTMEAGRPSLRYRGLLKCLKCVGAARRHRQSDAGTLDTHADGPALVPHCLPPVPACLSGGYASDK